MEWASEIQTTYYVNMITTKTCIRTPAVPNGNFNLKHRRLGCKVMHLTQQQASYKLLCQSEEKLGVM